MAELEAVKKQLLDFQSRAANVWLESEHNRAIANPDRASS